MKSNVNLKIINPNSKTQLENALIDMIVQQLIRKDEEELEYIDEKMKLAK